MPRGYVPDTGDIVWLHFDPQKPQEGAGHEQAGHRPALVLSPARDNGPRGMMLCCPMTTKIKGYPFEVLVPGTPPSAVLADQIKSLGWRARRAQHKGTIPQAALAEVKAKLRPLLGI